MRERFRFSSEATNIVVFRDEMEMPRAMISEFSSETRISARGSRTSIPPIRCRNGPFWGRLNGASISLSTLTVSHTSGLIAAISTSEDDMVVVREKALTSDCPWLKATEGVIHEYFPTRDVTQGMSIMVLPNMGFVLQF